MLKLPSSTQCKVDAHIAAVKKSVRVSTTSLSIPSGRAAGALVFGSIFFICLLRIRAMHEANTALLDILVDKPSF